MMIIAISFEVPKKKKFDPHKFLTSFYARYPSYIRDRLHVKYDLKKNRLTLECDDSTRRVLKGEQHLSDARSFIAGYMAAFDGALLQEML